MFDSFNQKIKDTMNNSPDFPFEERLWEDMEQRLDAAENPSDKPFMWLPFLLLLILSWGGLAYFVQAYYSTQNLLDLSKQVEKQATIVNSNQTSLAHLEKRNVVIYDTIYKKVYVEQEITDVKIKPNSNFISTPSRKHFIDWAFFDANLSKHQSFFSNSNLNYFELNGLPLSNQNINIDTPAINKIKQYKNNLTLINLPSIPLFEISQPLVQKSPQFLEQRKKRKKVSDYLYPLRPQSFSLSAQGGISKSFNIEESDDNTNAKINASIGYGSNFELLVGLEFLTNSFEYYLDRENINDFPRLDPNNSGDVLNEIYGDFKYIQIPFGIQYYFAPKSNLQPYIGLGLIAHKAIKSSLDYQYLSIMEEYLISQDNTLSPSFALSDMWSSIGVRYHLNSNWALLVEGSTQLELKKQPYLYQNHQYLKWNVGLQYQF